MTAKNPDIPFQYGSLVAVTPAGVSRVQMWFSDASGIIRGVTLDTSNPSEPRVIPEEEIVLHRRTEGQTRRRRASLSPVGAEKR